MSSTSPEPSIEPSRSATTTEKRRPFFPLYYNDVYEFKLQPNHRFPMDKYRKVRELVQHGINRTNNQAVDCEFRVSPLATVEELTLTHSPDYVQRFMVGDLTDDEIRNVGFPWSLSGVDRALSSVGGTMAAAVAVCEERSKRLAKADGGASPCWGAHIAGGTHHAFYDRGEGFCVFSDIAVAANVILQRFPKHIRRILILDLDVHQGNGNAVLFQGRPEVFTFSMHCKANYFSEKQNSDLDIELPVGCNDETYLLTLRHWLKRIRLEAGDFDFIFFQAGVDILEYDRLGRMNVSAAGIQRRNELVFEFAAKEMSLPLVIAMGGGYPRTNDWSPILDAHANVYLQAYQFLSAFAR
jgi:acetoin utilization deacetylase AcuC-like enzyme